MKVNAINYYSQNRANFGGKTSEQPAKEQSQSSYMSAAPLGTFNHLALSFGAKGREAPHYDLNLNSLRIKNLPCPCCGKTMIPSKDFEKIFATANLTTNGHTLIKMLEPYENEMRETEKQVFKKLKEISPKKPNLSLQELIMTFPSNHAKNLRIHQWDILNNILSLSSGLPNYKQRQLKNLIQDSCQKTFESKEDNHFKRKKFIAKIGLIVQDCENKKVGNRIYDEAQKLNNSQNDVNSFIVKYARRDSKEICRRFLTPSISTIEHIHPHCDFENKFEADKMTNLILECAACNNEKSDKTLLDQIQAHPQMIKNIQKYFDSFIEKMKSGEIPIDYKPEFLLGVAQTLEKESKGKIRIDLSKFRPV